MMTTKNQNLQLLRGIPILSVFFYHLSLSSTLLAYLHKDLANPFYWGAPFVLVEILII